MFIFGYDASASSFTALHLGVTVANSTSSQQFTGKERDAESGLDYFGARYYGSALGRFTSPDWSTKPQPIPYAKLENPQSLNLYAYVFNNPLAHRDADGHIIDDAALEKNKSYQKWKQNYLSHEGAQKQWNALNDNKDLTVHVSWDSKSSSSVTSGYQWDKSGTLTNVNVSLAGKTGDTSNSMSAESGYVHGSTLNNDGALRQAYVIAHEFAHVEFAQQPGAQGILGSQEEMGPLLKNLEKQLGPTEFGKFPAAVGAEKLIDETHYQLERNADKRAWDVLGDPK